MQYAFVQGYLDSLCGVYAIVNAEKIINKSSDEESQKLFNSIIEYISKKRQLKDTIVNGMRHTLIYNIITNVVAERIPVAVTNKRFHTLKEWWNYSSEFILEKENRVVLLCVAGREDHITVVKSMSDKSMKLFDSGAYGGIKTIRKSACKLAGTYEGEDRYIIYPSQCWFLGKE